MTTTQTDEIKTWQQRLEETCPALGPMHIHACVEEVNDAMQAEIDDLRAALQEQARETVNCECGRTHKSTSYGWASNEPAQPVALPLTPTELAEYFHPRVFTCTCGKTYSLPPNRTSAESGIGGGR